MNELADQLESEIQTIGPDLTPDQVAELRDKVTAFQERARALGKACDDAMLAYIQQTGQPIVIGSVRYYVGPVKKTKCRDQAECLQSLVETFGPKHVSEQFLSSGAFKHGAISKEVDEETFNRLFEVSYEEELKEGKPERVKKLQKADERFVR